MKIHSNDWEMILNNAHDPTAEYILILIIHYEIALLQVLDFTYTIPPVPFPAVENLREHLYYPPRTLILPAANTYTT